MGKYVIPFEECSAEHLGLVGGKNANLGILLNIGVPVPPGFAVTVEAYREFVSFNKLQKEIEPLLSKEGLEDSKRAATVSEQIRQIFRSASFPDFVSTEICESYHELAKKCGDDNIPVAVRSSAVEEDAPDASFAGQHETYLWVRGTTDLLSKVIECFSSLYTQRDISYRTSKGFKLSDAVISVGVQKMVKPRSAGVIFTIDPLTGDRSRIAVESVWGVGETLVGSEVDPDSFLVDKIFFRITKKEIKKKLHERVIDEKTGTKKIEIKEDRQSEPSVSDEEVVELAKLSRKIEQYYKRPMDIEFALETNASFPDNIFIVQARPETIWSRKKRQETTLSPLEYIAKDLEKGVEL